jgi:hypothetical protein
MRRAILIAAALLPLALAGAVSVWWYQAMGIGDHQLERAMEEARRDGWQISIENRKRRGFPLTMEWVVQGVKLHRALPAGTLTGRIPELIISAHVWSPQHIQWAIADPQEWDWQERGSDEMDRVTVNHAKGAVDPRTDAPGWQATVQLTDIVWSGPEGDGRGQSASALLQVPPPVDKLDLDLRVDQITLPVELPFGKNVQSVRFSGSLDPLLRALDHPSLEVWRAADGKIVLNEAVVEFGPLQTTLSGVLGLDSGFRPAGRLAANITDPQALLQVASEEGWIGKKHLNAARFALGALARRRADGQTELATDWRLQNGYLWLGPFQLAPLPPLTLPVN